MQISIVLVNTNRSDDTIRCIYSIKQLVLSEQTSCKVIVVNNGHESLDMQDDITVLEHGSNHGYAAACNLGITYCLNNLRPDYIWLLNNDTEVDARCLQMLLDASQEHPGIAIWGSTIFSHQPPHSLECSGGFEYHVMLSLPVAVKLRDQIASGKLFCQPRGMSYISGTSMFVRSRCFHEHGLLDESYFLYYEELSLMRQIGGPQHIAWCPASIVYHKGGGSTGSTNPNTGQGSAIAHYYGNRSALIYTWKYHAWYLPVVFVFRWFAKSMLFLWYRDLKAFKPMWHAYVDFLAGRTGRQRDYV